MVWLVLPTVTEPPFGPAMLGTGTAASGSATGLIPVCGVGEIVAAPALL